MAAELKAVLEDATVIAEANRRYGELEGYQSRLVRNYQRYHFFYAPPGDSQWPEVDPTPRPGKINMTVNIIRAAVDVESRLQAKLPRLILDPLDLSVPERARAEVAEKYMLAALEASGWDLWMTTLCRSKAIYGKGVVKVLWNSEEKRPDCRVVENPANLRIGWGSSDFSVMDWALYEYSLSAAEIMRRWPDILVMPAKGRSGDLTLIQRGTGTHADPLGQKRGTAETIQPYVPSDYENKQILVWDYWYKRGTEVYNCIILRRQFHAVPPTRHPELLDIPYVVIENDHEPGSPEGLSSVGPLLDIQIEMNRGMAHWAQLVADEIDPTWQVNADSLPPGMVPKAGQVLATGSEQAEIKPISKPVTTFPIQSMIDAHWFAFHRTSGLPEIAFGNAGGTGVSGRALSVQVEGAANRIDPRRTLLYAGLREVMIFWTAMVESVNPSVDVQGETIRLGAIFDGMRRWKFIAPEITPRDIIEHTNNTIFKVQSGMMSARTGMDEIGIDSPEDELSLVAAERSNMALNPGFVQQQLAVLAAAQQLQLTEQQAALGASVPGATPGAALNAAQDQSGANQVVAQQQAAMPPATEDMNQPPTAAGGVPPASLAQTTLVRSNAAGEPQTLNQIALQRQLGPGG